MIKTTLIALTIIAAVLTSGHLLGKALTQNATEALQRIEGTKLEPAQ